MNKSIFILTSLMLCSNALAQQVYSQHDFKLVAQSAVLATLCGMDEQRKEIDKIAGGFAFYNEAIARIEPEWNKMWKAGQVAGGQKPKEVCEEWASVVVPATVDGLKINPPIK